MKFLLRLIESQQKHFEKGGKLEKFYSLYEAGGTILFTPGTVTKSDSHIRDFLDLKRMMIAVVIALIPAVLMALYNTGYQANLVLAGMAQIPDGSWQRAVMSFLGIDFDPANIFANIFHGALYFFPIYIITLAVGGSWEALFAIVRKHEITEGFLVTSLLYAMILPPNLPYWQVAIGITFGVVIGKEVFGGVGMNILNPALAGRAFLYFAYPAQISGDAVWTSVDGISAATPLAVYADPALTSSVSWMNAFVGLVPGSMGETSALACLIGAFILIVSRVASWRIMLSITVGMILFSLLFNIIGSDTNPMFQVSPMWHFVLGGFALGAVFMATDPVSAAITEKGQYVYGFLIGSLTVLIRVINPAFPEGIMLAILFGNVFAPIIDRIFLNRNIKRRLLRSGSR